VAKRGRATVTICSTAFTTLGRAQAKALGYPDLPIAVVPHPFGLHTREEIRQLAVQCVDDIVRLASAPAATRAVPDQTRSTSSTGRAARIEISDDLDAFHRLCRERRWGDGLPAVPPTVERVERMLRDTRLAPEAVIATVAPGFGAATVERIAINAVLAGCEPEYLPVLIAAVEAVAAPKFNLQGIQATTNPVAVWLIVNGPNAKQLGMNSGINCLGQGSWANATLGRALHLILQNIGGALPGEMDRATQGQPGKYTFCCAENEEMNPWEPVHVERGFPRERSAVTVVAASGTLNMNTHSKDAVELLRVIADTMPHPPSNDYRWGGEPWIMLSPEHAEILKRGGLSKAEVKRRLWEQTKMAASRMAVRDIEWVQNSRRAELGEVGPHTLLPISTIPEHIGIIVAGGPGTHSTYIPGFGNSRSVTREVKMPS
jgi:hypothetical protein